MKKLQPVNPFSELGRTNFFVFQAVTFLALAYLYASWNLQGIAFLDPAFLDDVTSESTYSYWKRAPYFFPSLVFIYKTLPLTPEYVKYLQLVAVGVGCLGMSGVFPRLMAMIAFPLHVHLGSLFLIANDTMDASTTMLAMALLILALSPAPFFYQWTTKESVKFKEPSFWPVYLFWMVVAMYYCAAGINKIVEVGPHWPLWVRIDRYARWADVASWSKSIPIGHPVVVWMMSFYWVALAVSAVTLIIEVAAPILLFRFRGRNLFVLSFPLMHLFIFLTMGFGYTLYMILNVALIDWDQLLQHRTVQKVGTERGVDPKLKKAVFTRFGKRT